jgi:hypothetical protein
MRQLILNSGKRSNIRIQGQSTDRAEMYSKWQKLGQGRFIAIKRALIQCFGVAPPRITVLIFHS